MFHHGSEHLAQFFATSRQLFVAIARKISACASEIEPHKSFRRLSIRVGQLLVSIIGYCRFLNPSAIFAATLREDLRICLVSAYRSSWGNVLDT
jgi:hypothetical protein